MVTFYEDNIFAFFLRYVFLELERTSFCREASGTESAVLIALPEVGEEGREQKVGGQLILDYLINRKTGEKKLG